MTEIYIPKLTFNMLGVGRTAVKQVYSEEVIFFGKENYDEFREAGKKDQDISIETKQRVDREAYDKWGEMFGIHGPRIRKKFWDSTLSDAFKTHSYARSILFPDQDRRATLTTNIIDSDRRPSSIMKILTTPTRKIGEQCKFEQGLILGIALLCAEVRSKDEDGATGEVLSEVNDFLESKLFTGKKGDPKPYPIYSYHISGTNRLVGLSRDYPDPQFEQGLWVKDLEYPVRYVGEMPVLYDTREKDIASTAIKIMQRSLKDAKDYVETGPYTKDTVGFRLVNMEGGRPYRDLLTSRLEELFHALYDYENMDEDDRVDPKHGATDRVEFRRRTIHVRRLKKTPIEMIVQSLEDYIAEQYEVGSFSEKKGMHDGPAHSLYKLGIAADVAPCIWPSKLIGIDHVENKQTASYAYAFNLGRKQRIYPSPFID